MVLLELQNPELGDIAAGGSGDVIFIKGDGFVEDCRGARVVRRRIIGYLEDEGLFGVGCSL